MYVMCRRLIIVVATASLAVATIVFWYSRTTRWNTTQANLRTLAIALQQYHKLHGTFPPAYLTDAAGAPAHSWRVLLLPVLGYQQLYDQYRFDEPWNGPHNSRLSDPMPAVYASRSDNVSAAGECPFLAVVGSETVWPMSTAVSRGAIRSQGSGVIQLVVCEPGIQWMAPHDLNVEQAVAGLDGTGTRSGINCLRFVACADASVAILPSSASRASIGKMLSRFETP